MTQAFFDSVRDSLLNGSLKQSQVDGLNDILNATAHMPIRHRAYVLATAYHETGLNMAPNVENLNYTSAERIRAVWPSRFHSVSSARPYVRNPKGLANKVYNGRMGNRNGSDDGWNFRGRGQVHLTGRANYDKASAAVGYDLVAHPDLALRRDVSARILAEGMSQGWFTGKRLSDYYDYVDMRRVVNGTDQASRIAGYAGKFEAALKLIEGGPDTRRTLLSLVWELFAGIFRK